MVEILNGLVGGLVATIVMTAFMLVLGDDSPPPTAMFWSEYVGDGSPEEYQLQGLVLHLLYGVAAGGAFVALATALSLATAELGGPFLWGLGYGLLLFVVGTVFWTDFLLDMEVDIRMRGLFLFFHLVYGTLLGAWLAFEVL